MKALRIFFIILICTDLSAQYIQNGLVREQNSNRTPIPGVQINFLNSVPTNSDHKGNFRLVFQNKKPGDLIFFQEIKKKGYEIVNEKELQVLKIGNTEWLGTDIILVKEGRLDAARKEYYEISDRALTASFNKEREKLQSQLNNMLVSQKQYEEQFLSLYEKYQAQKKSLDGLSDLFARVNFDDVSSEYKQAFEHFEFGRVEEAIKVLEGVNLLARMEKRLKEKKRIEVAEKSIIDQWYTSQREIKEDLQTLNLQAELYVLTFQIEKAEMLYDNMLRIDNTDPLTLIYASDFFYQNNRYEKAISVCKLIIENSDMPFFFKEGSYLYMGDIYLSIGQLDNAMKYYLKIKDDILRLQLDTNTVEISHFYKIIQCNLFNSMGLIYYKMGELDKALDAYVEGNRLEEASLKLYPNSLELKKIIVVTHQRLGALYVALGSDSKALVHFEQMNRTLKELNEKYPDDSKLKANLATSYNDLGHWFEKDNQVGNSINFYEQGHRILLELNKSFPHDSDIKYSLSISFQNMGNLFYKTGRKEKAVFFFEQFNQLISELYVLFPLSVDFKRALAMSYSRLGDTYANTGRYALTSFEKSYVLLKELNETHPLNSEIKEELANINIRLANFYLKQDAKKASSYLKDSEKILYYLHKNSPKNTEVKKHLKIVNKELINLTPAPRYFLLTEITNLRLIKLRNSQYNWTIHSTLNYKINEKWNAGIGLAIIRQKVINPDYLNVDEYRELCPRFEFNRQEKDGKALVRNSIIRIESRINRNVINNELASGYNSTFCISYQGGLDFFIWRNPTLSRTLKIRTSVRIPYNFIKDYKWHLNMQPQFFVGLNWKLFRGISIEAGYLTEYQQINNKDVIYRYQSYGSPYSDLNMFKISIIHKGIIVK